MKNKSVCVFGLGYIGLPTASLLGDFGFPVVGIDLDDEIISSINNATPHIVEPDLEIVLSFTQTKTSRHIYYLKNAGLLNSRNEDQFIYYSIKEEAMDIIDQIFLFLDKDNQLKKDIETYDIMYSNRELSKNKLELKSWK